MTECKLNHTHAVAMLMDPEFYKLVPAFEVMLDAVKEASKQLKAKNERPGCSACTTAKTVYAGLYAKFLNVIIKQNELKNFEELKKLKKYMLTKADKWPATRNAVAAGGDVNFVFMVHSASTGQKLEVAV